MSVVTSLLPDEENRDRFMRFLHFALSPNCKDVLEEVTKRVEKLVRCGSEAEREHILREVISGTGCARGTALPIMLAVTTLARIVLARGNPEDQEGMIVEELMRNSSNFAKGEDQGALRALLDTLCRESPQLRVAALEGQVIRGVLPMFEDLDATVELRSTLPVFAADDTSDQVPFGLVPIASIRLSLDSGEPSVICFQVTEPDLVILSDRLNRVREEMNRLRLRVSITEQKDELRVSK
jgi:hypothetical protein